jgi:transcriptional regulator with XRE-family HTH domain
MPRPSKRVAPDTLGGRLRAARQSLHLSLADVAGERYSTSLISQIERNRVDPSPESLRYLAGHLKLPFDELQNLARQHRESETEANLYREYEAKYAEISQLLLHHQLTQAIDGFKTLDLNQMPHFMRWRTLALRGQTYYEQREFSRAQRDFQSALTILPASIAEEHQLEVVKLRLHLAAATRELNQLPAALEYYQAALNTMDASTPLRYVAEAHWGLALVLYRQARNTLLLDGATPAEQTPDRLLQEAWQHAENARTLYNAIADSLDAALLQCQIALIEQTRGLVEQSERRLRSVLDAWQPSLAQDFQPQMGARLYQLSDRANVVSAAACYLAAIAYQSGQFDTALDYVHLALRAGAQSYKVRQAEALIMQGQILEARDACDPCIEGAFRQAVDILRGTDRRAIQAQAHYQLGRYLLTCGKTEEASREIEKVRELAGIAGEFYALPSTAETAKNG